MTAPPVSVLMPVRNGMEHLEAALESMARQTFPDFECVIIDDGSFDSTPEMLDSFAESDPRFKVFHRPAAGIVEALNFGISHCAGEFIARMDADDISDPARIEKQVELLSSREDIEAVGCLVDIIPRPAPDSGMLHYEIWINSIVESSDISREIFVESPLPHPSAMIRKKVFDKLGGYRYFEGPEDYDLWLRMHSLGMKMTKASSTLLQWRDGPGRASRTDPRYSIEAFTALKAYHLVKNIRLRSGSVQIWGAGKTGKAFAKALRAEGLKILRFIDINPRKIGQSAAGVPVISPVDLLDYGNDFIIGAVGGRGARNARGEIRDALVSMGFVEGKQFLFVA